MGSLPTSIAPSAAKGRMTAPADVTLFVVTQREGAERSCGPGAMRFAAHFALALRATGLVSEPSWEADQYDPLQVLPAALAQCTLQTALRCWCSCGSSIFLQLPNDCGHERLNMGTCVQCG